MQQNHYRILMQRSTRWRADNSLAHRHLPLRLAPWLQHRGSLTAALKAIADGTFEVAVIDQSIKIPFWHEQAKLAHDLHIAALIRQVELRIYDEAVVYACSIIPLQLATKGVQGLGNIGNTPLGHLLFKDGRVRISKREYLRVEDGCDTLFARRTPYDYLGSQILVSELFLPNFNKYL